MFQGTCSAIVQIHNLPAQLKSAVMHVYMYLLVPPPEVQTGGGTSRGGWSGNETVLVPGCISPALLQCTAVLGQAA